MKNFKWTPEFEKEYRRLKKKFRSLDDDLAAFEKVLSVYPTGVGVKFTILHHADSVKIVKGRLACRALRDSSLRIIYAWQEDAITFVYIEIYHKADKENEDRERIKSWLKELE